MGYNVYMSKKYKILIVDDDKFLLDMYKKKFESNGAEVDVALGSEETLAKLRDGAKPDILILDVIMPKIDGIELLGIIRKEQLSPDSIVIMLTNESDTNRIKEAELLGISGYIVKAINIPTDVINKVWEIIKSSAK
ncbi:MAG: response regulator [Parcubacteria group bacterium GW2011_GWB1_38_8]|nr:MAG: response regulator [Parcubacteria group bacterium GW2011_GWB1_38_8]KKR30927.1 MAG: response regulator [Parcubacteria group bacterium GW2011_GWC1_39_8]